MLRVFFQSTTLAFFILLNLHVVIADDDQDLENENAGPLDDTLVVLEQEVCGKTFAITGTGAVWTFVPEGGPRFHEGKRVSATQPTFLGYDDDLLAIKEPPAENRIAYFDRGEWHIVPWAKSLSLRDRNGPDGRIVAGVDNTVLVVGKDTTLLIQDTKVIDDGQLLELLSSHRDIICKSFGPGVPHLNRLDRWGEQTMVVADPRGHIWCLHDEILQVLIGDQWHNCQDSLIKAGTRRGKLRFIIPGPDHRYFYVGDNKLRHDGGCSFLATFENDQVEFKPTFHAMRRMGPFPAVREGKDAIWIANPEGFAGNSSDLHTGQSAIRINQEGQATVTLRMSGYPLACDPNGNTWLGGIRGGPENQINIVRDGEIIQELTVTTKLNETFDEPNYMPVFSNSAGSVFVHSPEGLAHYVSNEKSAPRYQLSKHYSWKESMGYPEAISSQGYCISLVADDDVPLKLMYLTVLPEGK